MGKDVVCLQLAVTHQACDGARRRDLHGAVDVRRPYVQRTAEDAGKAQDVVDLVGEVGAPRSHHGGACGTGVLGVDLGRGVGAGKDDRVCGHAPHHLGRQDTRGGHADEDVGIADDLGEGAARTLLVGDGGHLLLDGVEALPPLIDGTLPVAHDDVAQAHVYEEPHDGHAGRPGARRHDAYLIEALSHQPQRVHHACQGDHGRAVLVVVEDGDVAGLLEPALDLEAARGADVLQVDAAEASRQKPHCAHDVSYVFGAHAQRDGVHAAEGLEQGALALHHGHARLGTYVAQAQDGRPVCYHSNRVPPACEGIALAWVPLDREAGLGDAGRVGEAHGRSAIHGHAGRGLDLSPYPTMQLHRFLAIVHDTLLVLALFSCVWAVGDVAAAGVVDPGLSCGPCPTVRRRHPSLPSERVGRPS